MFNNNRNASSFDLEESDDDNMQNAHGNFMHLLNKNMNKQSLFIHDSSNIEMDSDSESQPVFDSEEPIDSDIYGEKTSDNSLIILSDDEDKDTKSNKKESLSYRYDVGAKRKRSLDIARRALKKNKQLKHTRLDYLVDVPDEVKVLKSGSWLNTKTGQLVSRKIYRETGVLTNEGEQSQGDLSVTKEVYHNDGAPGKFDKYQSVFLSRSNDAVGNNLDDDLYNNLDDDVDNNINDDVYNNLNDDVDNSTNDVVGTNLNNDMETNLEVNSDNGIVDNSDSRIAEDIEMLSAGDRLVSNASPSKTADVSSVTPKSRLYTNLGAEDKKQVQERRLLKMDKANTKKVLREYVRRNDNERNDMANISRRATDSVLLDQVDNRGVVHNLIKARSDGTVYLDNQNDSVEEISAPEHVNSAQPTEDNDLVITDIRTATVRERQLRNPITGSNTVMLESEKRLREMAERINARRTNRTLTGDQTNALKEVLQELEKYPPHIKKLFENSSTTKQFQKDLKKFLPAGASDKLAKLGKLYFKFRALRGNSKHATLLKNNQTRGSRENYRRNLQENRVRLAFFPNSYNSLTGIEALFGGRTHILRSHTLPTNPLFEEDEYHFMERMMGEIEQMETRASDEQSKRTTIKRKGTLQKYLSKIASLPFDQSCDFMDTPKKEHLTIVRRNQQHEGEQEDNYSDSSIHDSPSEIGASSSHVTAENDALLQDPIGDKNTRKHDFEIKKGFLSDETSEFRKVNVCFLCATPLRTGIPNEFRGSRHKDQSFDYLVRKYGVNCPYVSLTAPTDTDRQYSRRVFIALPCGHAYCGRCVMRISNSMKLPAKLKERRKNVIGCGNPYIYGPDRCVVEGCKVRFNKPNSFRELYL